MRFFRKRPKGRVSYPAHVDLARGAGTAALGSVGEFIAGFRRWRWMCQHRYRGEHRLHARHVRLRGRRVHQ